MGSKPYKAHKKGTGSVTKKTTILVVGTQGSPFVIEERKYFSELVREAREIERVL